MKYNDDNLNDRRLRELLKASRFDAPPSPWFTKKVMNRLPKKHARNLAWTEYAIYVVAAVVTAVYGVLYAINIFQSGVVRVGDIAGMAMYLCAFCAILFLCLSPWFRTGEELPMK